MMTEIDMLNSSSK